MILEEVEKLFEFRELDDGLLGRQISLALHHKIDLVGAAKLSVKCCLTAVMYCPYHVFKSTSIRRPWLYQFDS